MSMPVLTLITPTRGRPEAFALLCRWVRAQEYAGPLRWLVCTDGDDGYVYPNGAEVLRRPFDSSANSLAANLLVGLNEVEEGDRVLILEDDDFYAPGYLAAYDAALDTADLIGAPFARYYHVGSGRAKRLDNAAHASLAQTGLKGNAVAVLRAICLAYLRRPRPFIDMALWQTYSGSKRLDPGLSSLHVSVKGMPGAIGYGIGHRSTFGEPDSSGAIAESWGLPEVYRTYRVTHEQHASA